MPKVLIIEDRRENIVFIANSILKPLGYDVITAMDGQSGLNKAQEELPDLIITDLKLPRLSGLEVLEHLSEQGLYIPTIVMTFHGTEDTAMRALRLGARDYLIKPFTIEEMQAALKRALRQPASKGGNLEARLKQAEQETEKTRAALAEREDQLKRLSTAAQMAARVPRLEQELARAKDALARQGQEPDQPVTGDNETGARTERLEQALAQARTALAARENQLRQMQQYLTSVVKRTDGADSVALKEENARLTDLLGKAKILLEESQMRVGALEAVMAGQKAQMGKYHQQARQLAEELRNLSEAVRLLSQDFQQQSKQLDLIPAARK